MLGSTATLLRICYACRVTIPDVVEPRTPSVPVFQFAWIYSATELKSTMKKSICFSKAIDCKAHLYHSIRHGPGRLKKQVPCNQSPI